MENLHEIIEEITEKSGYKLIEMNINAKFKNISLIIYKPNGISVKDCEKLSREIIGHEEFDEGLNEEYSLEVSSPGIDRILKSKKEYEIFEGKEIRITSSPKRGETCVYTGILKGIDSDNNILVEKEYDLYKIPFSHIKKSNLLFENSNHNGGER